MKKITLAATSLFILVTQAAHAEFPVMTCSGAESFQQDEGGKAQFVPLDLVVNILPAGAGWVAEISRVGEQTIIEKDVSVSSVSPENALQVKEMASLLAPQVKWEDVASVRVGNVGVKANQQDSAGIYVFDLLDRNSLSLAKLLTVGWSFGRCGK